MLAIADSSTMVQGRSESYLASFVQGSRSQLIMMVNEEPICMSIAAKMTLQSGSLGIRSAKLESGL